MGTERTKLKRKSGSRRAHFSGHETFPLRQLWLNKAYRYAASHKFDSGAFSLDSAIGDLGVGKNMVSSMRHWALATQVLTEDRDGMGPGALGELIVGDDEHPGLDPWFEDVSSAWIVHWMLSGRGARSTTWQWLFSRVSDGNFDKERLFAQLTQWCREEGFNTSANTLRRDIDTCIRCYLPKGSSTSTEEVAEPLLAELGLMSATGVQGAMRFNKGPKQTLADHIFYFAVLDFWDSKHAALETDTPKTIPLMSIALDYYSPGRVFKLGEEEIESRLQRAEDLTDKALIYDESVKNLTIDIGRLTPREVQTDRERNKYGLIRRAYAQREHHFE